MGKFIEMENRSVIIWKFGNGKMGKWRMIANKYKIPF